MFASKGQPRLADQHQAKYTTLLLQAHGAVWSLGLYIIHSVTTLIPNSTWSESCIVPPRPFCIIIHEGRPNSGHCDKPPSWYMVASSLMLILMFISSGMIIKYVHTMLSTSFTLNTHKGHISTRTHTLLLLQRNCAMLCLIHNNCKLLLWYLILECMLCVCIHSLTLESS